MVRMKTHSDIHYFHNSIISTAITLLESEPTPLILVHAINLSNVNFPMHILLLHLQVLNIPLNLQLLQTRRCPPWDPPRGPAQPLLHFTSHLSAFLSLLSPPLHCHFSPHSTFLSSIQRFISSSFTPSQLAPAVPAPTLLHSCAAHHHLSHYQSHLVGNFLVSSRPNKAKVVARIVEHLKNFYDV